VEPRISFVTLVVRQLSVSHRFYVEGLGWPVEFEAPGEVVMVRIADKVIFSLWQEDEAVRELGALDRGAGVKPFTLAQNLPSTEMVDDVLTQASAAGAPLVTDAVQRDWGGYSGYFADPDGFRWEIAYNPGPIGQSVL
jgi:predicted lactoylglutathione lyase